MSRRVAKSGTSSRRADVNAHHKSHSSPGKRRGDARPDSDVATAYQQQLALLPETYSEILAADLGPLANALAQVRRRQALYVGSGGALVVARLAADLHQELTGSLASAVTPLELVGMPPLHEHAVALFTASARHPDAAVAAASELRRRANPIVVVTHRERDELPKDLADPAVDVVTLPSVLRREGFLATNSVLAMATSVVRASGYDLPARLDLNGPRKVDAVRENTLILSGPRLAPVASDLETRLSETGLSAAQVTDYRNFAHGRHTGLARRIDETSVVALITPAIRDLADATLGRLPSNTHVIRLESALDWPAALLTLLVRSMRLVEITARGTNLDPARPRVPAFGRKLYRLSHRRLIPPFPDPVDRKLAAVHVGETSRLRAIYGDALDDWLSDIHEERFHGFVFDYDGTICTTAGRYELPEPAVQHALTELLESGAVLGFASGRGSSLHRDLRAWVAKRHWPQIVLGLYNGGIALSLDEELGDRLPAQGTMAEAIDRLQELPLAGELTFVEREHQLGVELPSDSVMSPETVIQISKEVLARPPALAVKVVASAHSIDVVPNQSAKARTLTAVQECAGGQALVVGDQGQVGGNDFELLAANRWSLSVDRVSGDPTRCWNLDRRGEGGPQLLLRYLSAIKARAEGFAMRWKQ